MVERRPDGEHRPQQELAVCAVEDSILLRHNALVQAGTGTGKSLAYLVPAILSDDRISVSTATKALSEQAMKDIAILKGEMREQTGQSFSSALLKGRDNYWCLKKADQLESMDKANPNQDSESLFKDEEVADITEPVESKGKMKKMQQDYKKMFTWANRTKTGDRSEAPAVDDEVWKGLSSTNTECPGKSSCPFGEQCFAEMARDKARKAKIVVTNHAIVGLDLENPESTLLGDRDVFIFDELHELDNYLSSAWGTNLTIKMISDALILTKKHKVSSSDVRSYDSAMENAMAALDTLDKEYNKLEEGLFSDGMLPVDIEAALTILAGALERLVMLYAIKDATAGQSEVARTLSNLLDSVARLLVDSEENVRWVLAPRNEKDKKPISLNCAPLRIGPRLMKALHAKNAIMIGTSATITVGGKFDSPIHDFALSEYLGSDGDKKLEHREFTVQDVGTPFDYPRQGMFYVPEAKAFPSPDYTNRLEHDAAVEAEALKLIKAAGGRTLLLTVKTERIKKLATYLKAYLPKDIKILCQGDAPNPQLVEEFIADERSILIATMGMWHGLDVRGKSCSLVIIDKIPFKPGNDPLAKARKEYADRNGRNGFMEVFVAVANIMLAQGAGRLIRSLTDRGVVAILDTRLRTKSYGPVMMRSLPPMGVFSDLKQVCEALERLTSAK